MAHGSLTGGVVLDFIEADFCGAASSQFDHVGVVGRVLAGELVYLRALSVVAPGVDGLPAWWAEFGGV